VCSSRTTGITPIFGPAAATGAWARFIKQVHEIDPRARRRCAGPMSIMAFIEQH
jgi:hypothetical protein